MRIKTSWPVLLAVLATMAPLQLAGEEVYRWVDADGVVHFGDKTSANPDAERVEIQPGGDAGLGAAPAVESMETDSSYNSQASRAQQQRDERAARRELAAERQRQAASACTEARQRVAKLEPSPRVLEEQADGSVKRMDDDRRLELLAEAKAYIADNCDR